MSRFLKAIWESVPRGAGRHGHTRTWSASRCNTDSDTRQATLPGTFSRSGNDMPPRHRRNDGYCPHNSMPSSTISCCPTAYRRRPTLSDSSQRSRSSSANGGGTLTSSLVTLQGRLVHVEGGKPDAIHRNVSEEELSPTRAPERRAPEPGDLSLGRIPVRASAAQVAARSSAIP